MNRRRYILSALAMGFVMLTLWSLLGFWSRWICWDALVNLTTSRHERLTIVPSRLLPEDIEEDPEVIVHSKVELVLDRPSPQEAGLGIVDDISTYIGRQASGEFLYWDGQPDGAWAYLDKARGLIVHRPGEKGSKGNQSDRKQFFMGPEGVAESPTDTIGRFHSPVVGLVSGGLIVFDSELRRFFKIRAREPYAVVKGPELDIERGYEPIRITWIAKGFDRFELLVEPPMREMDPNDPDSVRDQKRRRGEQNVVPTVALATGWSGGASSVLTLDASGRIGTLDLETLTITGVVGSLPGVPELFAGLPPRSAPRASSAFSVLPIYMSDDFLSADSKYVGCAAAASNRDGSATTLAVYDKMGRQTASRAVHIASAEVPGGALATGIQFCLQNLHPPILSLLSFFQSPYYAGGAGYRSLFAVPDSFIAKKGRGFSRRHPFRLVEGFALIAPGIILVVAPLAFLLRRRAKAIGLSKDARTLWLLATVAFGVPAYLTYRLTEPRMRLVTCRNCGKLRRPDMDRCHHCRSLWDVPELIAPTWRVLDEPQEDTRGLSSMPTEEQSTEPDPPAEQESV